MLTLEGIKKGNSVLKFLEEKKLETVSDIANTLIKQNTITSEEYEKNNNWIKRVLPHLNRELRWDIFCVSSGLTNLPYTNEYNGEGAKTLFLFLSDEDKEIRNAAVKSLKKYAFNSRGVVTEGYMSGLENVYDAINNPREEIKEAALSLMDNPAVLRLIDKQHQKTIEKILEVVCTPSRGQKLAVKIADSLVMQKLVDGKEHTKQIGRIISNPGLDKDKEMLVLAGNMIDRGIVNPKEVNDELRDIFENSLNKNESCMYLAKKLTQNNLVNKENVTQVLNGLVLGDTNKKIVATEIGMEMADWGVFDRADLKEESERLASLLQHNNPEVRSYAAYVVERWGINRWQEKRGDPTEQIKWIMDTTLKYKTNSDEPTNLKLDNLMRWVDDKTRNNAMEKFVPLKDNKDFLPFLNSFLDSFTFPINILMKFADVQDTKITKKIQNKIKEIKEFQKMDKKEKAEKEKKLKKAEEEARIKAEEKLRKNLEKERADSNGAVEEETADLKDVNKERENLKKYKKLDNWMNK